MRRLGVRIVSRQASSLAEDDAESRSEKRIVPFGRRYLTVRHASSLAEDDAESRSKDGIVPVGNRILDSARYKFGVKILHLSFSTCIESIGLMADLEKSLTGEEKPASGFHRALGLLRESRSSWVHAPHLA